MKLQSKVLTLAGATFAVSAVQAGIVDRPTGFRIGDRLTLKPYVSLEYTYDTNTDQQPDSEDGSSWYVNPHLNASFKTDTVQIDADAFYGYRAYAEYGRQRDAHDYGENLKLAWTSSAPNEKGWAVLLNERFSKISADDDMQNNNGRGLWRPRTEFNIEGAVERRFTDKLHALVNGSYYYLDYDNDGEKYQNLYGWQRLVAGAEVGYALSKWTDFLIAGSYQSYTQDNADDLSHYSQQVAASRNYSRESSGYTVQGGIGSRATDRITYRVLAGWSRFEYGDIATDDGFTYSVSGNWKISDTWNTMLMAQSYYQPSEREYGSANRVDSLSWGLAHTMIRGKLNATFDAAYRRETREYTDASSYDYDEDIISFRLGFDYTLNRFLALYLRGEYQDNMFNGDMGGVERDYDRFRLTVGCRLQY